MFNNHDITLVDPTSANKNPKVIKAAQEELGAMDVLVCGKCYSVFHFIQEFQEHKMQHVCGEAVFKTNISESKPQVWAFLLWKSSVLNKQKNSKDQNVNSWQLYQTWCKMSQNVRDAWITAGRAIQGFSAIANAKIQPAVVQPIVVQPVSKNSIPAQKPVIKIDSNQIIPAVSVTGKDTSPKTHGKKVVVQDDQSPDVIITETRSLRSTGKSDENLAGTKRERKQSLRVRSDIMPQDTDTHKENIPRKANVQSKGSIGQDGNIISVVEIKEEKLSDSEAGNYDLETERTPDKVKRKSKTSEHPPAHSKTTATPAQSKTTAKGKIQPAEPSSNKVKKGRPSRATDENETDDDAEEKEYVVEKILAKRFNPKKKTFEYLLKWEGYPMDQNTWEPVENMAACDELVEAFERNLAKMKSSQSSDSTPSTSKKDTPVTSQKSSPALSKKSVSAETSLPSTPAIEKTPSQKVIAALSQKGIVTPSQKVIAALNQKGIGLSHQKPHVAVTPRPGMSSATTGTPHGRGRGKRKESIEADIVTPGGSRPVRSSKMKAMEQVKSWVGSMVKRHEVPESAKRKADSDTETDEDNEVPEKRARLEMFDDDWRAEDSEVSSEGSKQGAVQVTAVKSPAKSLAQDSSPEMKRKVGRPPLKKKPVEQKSPGEISSESNDSSPQKYSKSEPPPLALLKSPGKLLTSKDDNTNQKSLLKPPIKKRPVTQPPLPAPEKIVIASSKGILPVDPKQLKNVAPGIFVFQNKPEDKGKVVTPKTPAETYQTTLIGADANIELPESGIIRKPANLSNTQLNLPVSGVIRRPFVPDTKVRASPTVSGIIRRSESNQLSSPLSNVIIGKVHPRTDLVKSGLVKKPVSDLVESESAKRPSEMNTTPVKSGIVRKPAESKANVVQLGSENDAKKANIEDGRVESSRSGIVRQLDLPLLESEPSKMDVDNSDSGLKEMTSESNSLSISGPDDESLHSIIENNILGTELSENDLLNKSETSKAKPAVTQSGILKMPAPNTKSLLPKSGIIKKPATDDENLRMSGSSNAKLLHSGIMRKPGLGTLVKPQKASSAKILPKPTSLQALPSGVVKISSPTKPPLLAPRSNVVGGGLRPVAPKGLAPKTLGIPRGMSMLTARPGLSPRFGGQGSPFRIKKSPLISSVIKPRFPDSLGVLSPGSQVKSGVKPIHAMLGKSVQSSYTTLGSDKMLLGSKILAKQSDKEFTLFSSDKERPMGRGRGKISLSQLNNLNNATPAKQKVSKLIEGDGLHMQFEEADSTSDSDDDSLPDLPMEDVPVIPEPDSPPPPLSLCPETGKILCRAEGEKTPPPSPVKEETPELNIEPLEQPGESNDEVILPDRSEDLGLITAKTSDSETILKVEMSPGGTTGTVVETSSASMFADSIHTRFADTIDTRQATVVTKISSPDGKSVCGDPSTIGMMTAANLTNTITIPASKLFQDAGEGGVQEEMMAITGEDGLLYHITSEGAVEGETVLVQGEDGEQQCLYLTSSDGSGVVTLDPSVAEAVAHLGQDELLSGSQFVIKDADNESEIVMASVLNEGDDTMQAQVVAQVVHEGDTGTTGMRKVVLMLPNGNLMMTEVDEEQYAALELNK